MLSRSAIDRLICMCVRGNSGETKSYAATMLARDSELAPVRKQIADQCTAEFGPLVIAAMPWLAEEVFMPRAKAERAKRPQRDVRGILDAAGWQGLRRRLFDPEELEPFLSVIVDFEAPSGGRPWKMIRLAKFAPPVTTPRDIRAMLEAAGREGRARTEFTAEEISDVENEIAEFEMRTGGRPKKMIRLRTFDARFNPFAMPD